MRTSSALGSGRLTGAVLVTVQVGLAVILLIGAGLMVRSLQRLRSVAAEHEFGLSPSLLLLLPAAVLSHQG